MSKFDYVTKLLCRWVLDETLMYYSWHYIMLESRIVGMLLDGVGQKLAI
jgi:hypothetical protein